MSLPIEECPPNPGDTVPPPALRRALAGVGFVLLSALAFASTPAFVRLAYDARVNDMSLVAFRCLIAAAVLMGVSRLLKEPVVPASGAVRLLALGALLFGPQMWVYFVALHHLDTSITVAVVYAYPALVAVMAAVQLRRAPRMVEVLSLSLALCGVVVIAAVDAGSGTSQLGLWLAASTAFAYALYVLLVEIAVRSLPPLAAAVWMLGGAGVSTAIIAIATHRMALPATRAGWLYVALHGLVIVPVGLGAYYAGLKRLGATRTSIVDTSQPAIATLIGVTLLGERLDEWQLLGIVLIVLAVLGLPLTAARALRRAQTRPAALPPGRADLNAQARRHARARRAAGHRGRPPSR